MALQKCPVCEGKCRRPHCKGTGRRLGGAVARNQWKRRLRDAFRLSQHELPTDTDFILIPRPGTEPTQVAVLASLVKLAKQAARKLGPKPA